MAFGAPAEPSPPPQPLRTALGLAVLYALLCGAYIVLSDRWAAERAGSVEELASLGLWKGLAFIGATALLLFGLALGLLRRVARQREELLRYREALVSAERSAMVGMFASSLAHDLRNLLAVIEGHAEQLRDRPEPGVVARAATEVEKATEGLRAFAERLLQVGRSGLSGGEAERRVSDVVREALAFGQAHGAVRRCRVESEIEETPLVRMQPDMMRNMLLNLLLNAAEAEPGGRIRVRVARSGDAVRVEVHDGGAGVPAERRGAVFEPFVSSKERGSGLGLLSVKACAEWHGGSVAVEDSPLGGACFRVELSLREAPATG